jgi:hypothetical protein
MAIGIQVSSGTRGDQQEIASASVTGRLAGRRSTYSPPRLSLIRHRKIQHLQLVSMNYPDVYCNGNSLVNCEDRSKVYPE